MNELNYYAIGTRIRKYRKAQGITQEQLAEMIGIYIQKLLGHFNIETTLNYLKNIIDDKECLELKCLYYSVSDINSKTKSVGVSFKLLYILEI